MAVRTATGGDLQANLGEDGAYVKIREVTRWHWKAERREKTIVHSGTSGVAITLLGAGMASGTIEGVYDEDHPIAQQFKENDSFTVRLITMPGHYIQCPIVICSMEIDEPIMQGDLITWTASFKATGLWTYYPVPEVDLMTPI